MPDGSPLFPVLADTKRSYSQHRSVYTETEIALTSEMIENLQRALSDPLLSSHAQTEFPRFYHGLGALLVCHPHREGGLINGTGSTGVVPVPR